MSVTRREFLETAAGAGAGALLLGAETARATHDSVGKPDHVTLSFDEDRLQQFQPKLITGHLDVRPSQQYAWIAESTDEDDDVYTYWTFYVTQRGLTSGDSHILDREPIFVFVDPDVDEVTEVIYSAYHWLARSTTSPPTIVDDDGEHPTLKVVKNWHHYLETTDEDGVFVDLASMDDVFDEWLANGWEDDIVVGGAQNPWIMRRRSSWWRDDAGGSFNVWLRRAYISASRLPGLNIQGAGETDL